jgi:hypothetical protein
MADHIVEDAIGWAIIVVLAGNLTFHFVNVFIGFLLQLLNVFLSVYNSCQNCGKEKKHMENIEKINNHFKGALVGLKSYALEYKEK